MRYVTALRLAAPLGESPRLEVVPAGVARSASIGGKPPPDLDDLVDHHMCRPRLLNDDASPFLIACGFRLRLRPPVRLRWARLRVAPAAPDTTVMSVFPRAVGQTRRFTGRLIIAPDGRIDREPAADDVVADTDTTFEPFFAAGALPDERGAFWDVHSVAGEVPGGTDQLVLAVGAPQPTGIALSLDLLLAIRTHPGDPDIHLRAPTETALIGISA